ncbi:hypothetical protein BRDCF_p2157 [Bacteroidales bacterium CF]|nr:hypothetical protein BRDCF_p2157 [Bacteroidales bacterium CF]
MTYFLYKNSIIFVKMSLYEKNDLMPILTVFLPSLNSQG